MERIQLSSGNKVNITLAPITDSFRLFQEVVKAFKQNGLEIKLDRNSELSFMDIFEKNASACLGGLLDIISSQKVIDCIMDCCSRCTYDNGQQQKINMNLFDDEELRGDYFEVLVAVAKANLLPFFPALRSKSKATPENSEV